MPIVNEYRYKCTTESKYIFEWREEDDSVPSKCKNDDGHTIDSSSITIIRTEGNDALEIREETTKTGGHYRAESIKVSMSSSDSVVMSDNSWLKPINCMSVAFITTDDQIGDLLDVSVGPETPIGILLADSPSGSTVFTVNSTVLEYIKLGFGVLLSQSGNINDCGEVIAIDKNANTITVETATTSSFNAGVCYVLMTVYMITNYEICAEGRWIIGDDKIGGSYVPTGTVVRIKYTNLSEGDRTFRAQIGLLY